MLGLAVGDAIGTTLEFKVPNRLGYGQREMVGGGPFKLKPGEWTDDTSMALCLAESLIRHPYLNPNDLMKTFSEWYRDGLFSVTGKCFDIGNQTRAAIERWERTGQRVAEPSQNSGNGCIMRLAPVAIRWHTRTQWADSAALRQTMATHNNASCVTVASMMMSDLINAINGRDIIQKRARKVYSTGEVADTYNAAHWALRYDDGFDSVVLRAANMGGDADTVAAVAGQLAGARYGARAIPRRWLAKLAWRKTIEQMALKLYCEGIMD
jgi:ADP-ribosyl-[dinitrogen reductase] hydrolase